MGYKEDMEQARQLAEQKAKESGYEAQKQEAEESAAPEQKTEQTTQEIDFAKHESDVLKFLGDKLGREVDSFDSLNQVKETVTEKEREYFSEEAKALDEYIRDTGRGASDFAKLKTDWDSVDDDKCLLDYYKGQHDYLTEEQVKLKIEATYEKPKALDPDEHESEEIQRRETGFLARSYRSMRN